MTSTFQYEVSDTLPDFADHPNAALHLPYSPKSFYLNLPLFSTGARNVNTRAIKAGQGSGSDWNSEIPSLFQPEAAARGEPAIISSGAEDTSAGTAMSKDGLSWESVHVCPSCGRVINLAELDLRAITTGIVACPSCDWSGQIEIQIIDQVPRKKPTSAK